MEKVFYRRHLPHYTPSGVDFFITYHLAGSLPQSVLRELQRSYRSALERMRLEAVQSGFDPPTAQEDRSRIQKLYFAGYDAALDSVGEGPRWLSDPRLAEVVRAGLHALVEERHYDLWCFTILSNHVHALFQHPAAERPPELALPALRETMQLLKGRSAYACNKLLNRRGAFWQDESYDHYVRDGEFQRIVLYILNNPVKAGLVRHWSEWPWSYVHPAVREMLGLDPTGRAG